jgi:hypothetical protein
MNLMDSHNDGAGIRWSKQRRALQNSQAKMRVEFLLVPSQK